MEFLNSRHSAKLTPGRAPCFFRSQTLIHVPFCEHREVMLGFLVQVLIIAPMPEERFDPG
jgi:hypothetical protein